MWSVISWSPSDNCPWTKLGMHTTTNGASQLVNLAKIIIALKICIGNVVWKYVASALRVASDPPRSEHPEYRNLS